MVAQKKFRVASFVVDKAIKAPCVVETSVNITLFAEQTVNTVAVLAGDRVLVKDQTDPTENGIYDVQATAWTRSADWDGERDATKGTMVIVVRDPLLALWQLDNTAGDLSIGVDAAPFAQVQSADLGGNLASTANGAGASLVAIEDAAGNYVATDVEAALVEVAGQITDRPVPVFKLATETVISSEALQADDDLSGFVLEANATYYVEGVIFGSQNVGGFRYGLIFSETLSVIGAMQFEINDATGGTTNFTIGNTGADITKLFPGGGSGGLNDGQTWFLKFKTWFVANASDGGIMDFGWAQETSSANATNVARGSNITLTKFIP